MGWLLRLGIGLAILVGGAVIVLPLVISKEDLTEKAENAGSKALGRTIQIGEVSGINIFPPRLTLSELTVANAEGFGGPPLVQVERAQLAVQLLPLIRGSVVINTFVLDSPSISLATRQDGFNNFTLGAPSAEAGGDESAAQQSGTGKALVTGTITVNDGSVTYTDGIETYSAQNVDATLVLPPVGAPLKLNASMELEGLPSSIELNVSDFWKLSAANSVDARFKAALAGNSVSGEVSVVATPLTLSGPIQIKLDSLESLEPLIGAETIAAAAPLGRIGVEGRAEFDDEKAGFREASFETALAKGTGDFVVKLDGERPSISGELKADGVDARAFFPPAPEPAPSGAASAAPASGFPPWSEEPMDFSGLQGVDANLKLEAKSITLPTYSLSEVAADVEAVAGLVKVKLRKAKAFAGTATGNVSLDARRDIPRIGTQFDFSGIDFAQAAPALAGTDKIAGSGGITFNLQTTGNSQKAWVGNLDGTATANVTSGSIIGVDLNAIANTGLSLVEGVRSDGSIAASLGSAFAGLTANAAGPEARTDFDLANMQVNLSDGVAQFGGGQLRSDTFRATVGGETNLLQQTVGLSVLLAAKAPEATSYKELKAPVVVGGTFSKPTIKVDTAPLARELARGAATDALGRAGIKVEEGSTIKETLKEKARSELLGRFGLGGGKQKDTQEKE